MASIKDHYLMPWVIFEEEVRSFDTKVVLAGGIENICSKDR